MMAIAMQQGITCIGESQACSRRLMLKGLYIRPSRPRSSSDDILTDLLITVLCIAL